MRGKEEEHDYRYFPEPDLPPVTVDRESVRRAREDLPEQPGPRKRRMIEQYGLGGDEAQLLTLERALADYYEDVARLAGNPRVAANFVINEVLRVQKSVDDFPLPAGRLAELIRLVDSDRVSLSAAKWVFDEMCRGGRPAEELIRERGLEQQSDEDALLELVRRVLEARPGQVEQYRAGKRGLLGFFVGEVMKESGGSANPRKVSDLLRQELD